MPSGGHNKGYHGPNAKTRGRITKLINLMSALAKPRTIVQILEDMIVFDPDINQAILFGLLNHETLHGRIFRERRKRTVETGICGNPSVNFYSLTEWGHQEDLTKREQFTLNERIFFFKITTDRTKYAWDC